MIKVIEQFTARAARKGVLLSFLRLVSCSIVVGMFGGPAFSQPIPVSLNGELTQGGLVIGNTVAGAAVQLNSEVLMVSKEGVFVFGFGRDAQLEHLLIIKHGDQRRELPISLRKRTYKTQYIEGISKAIMQPSEQDLKRIRSDTALVKAARKLREPRLDFLEGFEWPLVGRITGVYGSQRYYNGVPKRPHFGIDIAAPQGHVVYAPASGKVSMVHSDMFYSGGTLIIDHGFGVSSTFLHLHKLLVEENAYVQKGDPIAQVGSSGRSTGPHLDWRINWFNQRIDPSLVAGAMPEQ